MTDAITTDVFETSSDEEVTDIFAGTDEQPQPFKEKAAPDRKAGPRASGADYLGAGVALAGTLLVAKRIDIPVGRCVQFQSPVTGKKLDEFIANTWIDKLLQPLFKKGDQLNDLGAVLGLPILVGIIERKPEMFPMLAGTMSELLITTLEEMAETRRKERTKTRRTMKNAEIRDMMDIPEEIKDENIPTFIIQQFFSMEGVTNEGEG